MSLFFSATANKKATVGAVGLIAHNGPTMYQTYGSTGLLWSWGYNGFGAVGDNSTTNRFTPVSVLGTVKTFCQINGACGIDKNGRAWGWGINGSGQIGDNTIVSKLTPVSVLGAIKTFCQIANGASGYRLAIDKNGRLWGWGINTFGQLGDNTIINKSTPVSVLGAIKTFCKIFAGDSITIAIDKSGRAWGWGYNGSGQIGDNTIVSKRTPVSVLGTVKTFCEIAAGLSHSVAIDKNGRAWGWGSNDFGELGDNTIISKRTPVSVLGAIKTFCKIHTYQRSTLAIDKNGRAWGWGSNGYGELGDSTLTNRSTPVSVLGAVKTFCDIKSGLRASIAIDKYGKIWSWGQDGTLGTLGINATNRKTPSGIRGIAKTFCQISGGINTALAIDKNGRAWGWGYNSRGQLGNNTIVDQCTPVSVLGTVKTFCEISTGYGGSGNPHTMAIDKNGRAWGWGYNGLGQIGDNTIVSKLTPVSVLGAIKTFCHISSGGDFTSGIDKNGRAWGWGYNSRGQIGNNTIISQRTPVSVLGAIKTFCKISTGASHAIAIDKNGRLWGWGDNLFGQLGDNTIISKRTPISVLGAIKTFCQISAGRASTLAIDKNGRAWGWGYNANGQLGDNSLLSKLTPVSVLGAVKTFCKISYYDGTTLAIDKNGRVWAWGVNTYGQLGDNTTTDKSTPVSVLGAVKTFCEISMGPSQFFTPGAYSFGIDKYGKTWAWGLYSFANGSYINIVTTPVQICNI